MSQISDELLMAYADGELSGAERASVESYVRQSAEAVARFAVFATTGKDLAGLFDQPMREPVPQRLLDIVKPPVAAPRANENVIPFAARKPAVREPAYARTVPMAMAACVALLAVGAGSYWLMNGRLAEGAATFALTHSANGTLVAAADLAAVLETVPSVTVAKRDISGASAEIEPVLTFTTASNEFCRQYAIRRDAAEAIGGVACREASGQWRIESQVETGAAAANKTSIKVAGPKTDAAIDAVIDRLQSGNVLGGDEETALFKSGWTSTAP